MSIERHRASSITADTLCAAKQTFASKIFIYIIYIKLMKIICFIKNYNIVEGLMRAITRC